MNEEEIKALSQKAQTYLRSAQILLDNDDIDSCISRTYYAMYFMARAILLTKNIKARTHAGTINQFSKTFIKTNIFKKEIGKNLSIAFEKRLIGDYELFAEVTKSDTEELLDIGIEFVHHQ